jgi:hypothetical protein
MITDVRLEECLGSLSTLRYFPSNPFAIQAVAEIVREVCQTDDEALTLTQEVLRGLNEWCGPGSFRKAYMDLIEKRKEAESKRISAERIAGYLPERSIHEATCPGYTVCLDGDNQTVFVHFCTTQWGDWWDGVKCRKGDALEAVDAGLCKRLLFLELASRPGWLSEDDRWLASGGNRKARLKARPKPGEAVNGLIH